MDTVHIFLQHYWWFIISLLGALLVFLLFVQGGQAMLYTIGRTETERNLIVNSLGRKWELTFTTLVTFGGAFFASFPLFYSTSFGGAFYVWMLILLVFVIQAVSYEYRRKPSNFLGEKTFNAFLIVNGIAGTFLLGTAVGTLFFGAQFTVDRANFASTDGFNTISQWATPWYGLDALADPRNILLGLAVLFLSRVLGLLYFMNNIDERSIFDRSRRHLRWNAAAFVATFVTFLVTLLLARGWAVDPASGRISEEPYKYLHNLLAGRFRAAGRRYPLRAVGHRRGAVPPGPPGYLVRRRGHGADRALSAADSRVQRYGLLPLADRSAELPDDLQQLLEPVHALCDEHRLAAHPVRGRLHLVCLAVDEPGENLREGARQGGSSVLTSFEHPG